ncbi:MAG TPA: hypothetical protein VGK27_10605 [Candidatus Deferrimicrobiaceae bacterium]|jgi:hypothetical protein
MTDGRRWTLVLGVALAAAAALLYFLQYEMFGDLEGVWRGLISNLAFLPVYVLVATLMLDTLMRKREKAALLKKLNMVIGVFYTEVGTRLLELFSEFDLDAESLRGSLADGRTWDEDDFARLAAALGRHPYRIDCSRSDMDRLRAFLLEERAFLLGLLTNPNLLEHDTFTDLLWAVFHLVEELAHRAPGYRPEGADAAHLANDINRAYSRMASDWLAYMKHLKGDYPYLFSLALRTSPFDPSAKVEVG